MTGRGRTPARSAHVADGIGHAAADRRSAQRPRRTVERHADVEPRASEVLTLQRLAGNRATIDHLARTTHRHRVGEPAPADRPTGARAQVIARKETPEDLGVFGHLDPLIKKQYNDLLVRIDAAEKKDLPALWRLKAWLRAQKSGPDDPDWGLHRQLLEQVATQERWLTGTSPSDLTPLRPADEPRFTVPTEDGSRLLFSSFLDRLDSDSEVRERYVLAVDHLYRLAVGPSNLLGELLDLSELFMERHGIAIIVMNLTSFKATTSDEFAAGQYVPPSSDRKGRLRLAGGVPTEELAETLAHELMHMILQIGLDNDSLPYPDGEANFQLLSQVIEEWRDRARGGNCPTILTYLGRSPEAVSSIRRILSHLLDYDAPLVGDTRIAKELLSHFVEIYFVLRQAGVRSTDINFALREDFPMLWKYYTEVTRLKLPAVPEFDGAPSL